MDELNETLRSQFLAAVEVSNMAYRHLLEEPVSASKRGQPRVNPYFRIWDGATANVVRLARVLRTVDLQRDLDVELAELLGGDRSKEENA